MEKRKYLVNLVLSLVAVFVLTACSGQNTVSQDLRNVKEPLEYGININEDSISFVDDWEKEHTISKNPKRVVCLYNSYLDLWYKCGGEAVGRVEPSKDKPVKEAKDAEVVGTLGSPSVEKILSLEPDLVILSAGMKSHRDIAEMLGQNGISAIGLSNNLKEDYFRTVRLFTALTGREDLYTKHAENVNNSIEKLIEKVPEDKEPTVLVIYASAHGIKVRTSNSTLGEMLNDLGTINISDSEEEDSGTKTFSLEKIIEEDPDFIFTQISGSNKEEIIEKLKKDVESNPAWSTLTAVKKDRYIVLPKDLYLYKPNDRYYEAYEGLAKILYPEIFK